MRYNKILINLKGDDNVKPMSKIINNVDNKYYEVTTVYNNGLEDVYIKAYNHFDDSNIDSFINSYIEDKHFESMDIL